MRLFWRKGYAATSIEDLTKVLELSRSSLYDTFGDKRTLFLDALKSYSDRVLRRVGQTLHEADTPLNGIQAIFDDMAAGVGQEAGAMGCFVVNSIAELTPYDADVADIAAAYNTAFQGLLAEAFQRDSVNRMRTLEQLAAYVFNTIQGMRILIKSGATREQIAAISAITMESLL